MLKNENMSELSLFQRTKWFWSWVYVCVVAFAQFARKSEKIIVTLDIEYQKLISHSVTRRLSLCPSFPRMLQMYPASQSYFMSIDQPTVVLKRLFGNFVNKLFLTHYDICNHLWLLLMNTLRILRSRKHHLLRLYRVSPLWRQGSSETIRCTYQAKPNQH